MAFTRRRIRRRCPLYVRCRLVVGRGGMGVSESVVCCSVCHDFLLFVVNREEYLKNKVLNRYFLKKTRCRTLIFKAVTSGKAMAVQKVMQNSQNAKTSLPTEYLCRTSKGLYLDKNICIL